MKLEFSKEAEKSVETMIKEAISQLSITRENNGTTVIGVIVHRGGVEVLEEALRVTDVYFYNPATASIDTQVVMSSLLAGGILLDKDGEHMASVIKIGSGLLSDTASLKNINDVTARELTIGYLKTWGYIK